MQPVWHKDLEDCQNYSNKIKQISYIISWLALSQSTVTLHIAFENITNSVTEWSPVQFNIWERMKGLKSKDTIQ